MSKQELQDKINQVRNKCSIWEGSRGDHGACLSYESNGEYFEWLIQLKKLEE